MKKTFFTCFFLGMSVLPTLSKTYDKVDVLERPVPISSIKDIKGFFGYRMEVNRNYLKDFPIDKYVDFVVQRQHTAWDWTKAEQHGKWIESAYLSGIQRNDKALLDKARTMLKRIVDSQEESGYVGATSKDYRSDERPVRGMDAYELYFVFHAFITVYEETGDKASLAAAEKLADYYLKYFGPGKLEFWPSDLRDPENRHKSIDALSQFAGHGVHYSWEGTLLCDPIARLYEVTGKKKYLDWSLWVVGNIDKWSGWDAFSRLDSVADGTLGVDKLQPYVHSHTFQMNFMGFLRLYRITGDKSLFRKVAGAWDDICNRQMYITGGVSVAEDCESGTCRYHTAPNGTKPHDYFHGPDCCTASGHRIISLLPTFFYAENGKDFYINQYLPSRYDGKDFAFEISGNYPESESMVLTVLSSKNKNKILNLRIPSWCKAPEVSVNGERVSGIEAGKYLAITHKWEKGDKIGITFPMEGKWIRREHHSKYTTYTLPRGEIMYREEPTDKIPYAFIRGPLVYCLDMVWNKQLCNDDVNMEKDIRMDTNSEPKWIQKPDTKMLGPVYQTQASYMGRKVDVLLTPFANIGQWFRPGEEKPYRNADAFTYAIWLYK